VLVGDPPLGGATDADGAGVGAMGALPSSTGAVAVVVGGGGGG
jgi:hypothetical protein